MESQDRNAADAIAAQASRFVPFLQEHLASRGDVFTGNPRLTEALKRHYAPMLLNGGVIVPGDPEEMRWRLFFAHSQDMNGFRADIFTGGPNEEDNPYDPQYRGLRDRWSDGRTMIEGLAALWESAEGRAELLRLTTPPYPTEGIAPSLALLRGQHGNAATRTFADAFEQLQGPRIAHKTNKIVRAYCQNSSLLKKHDCCFLTYLKSLASLTLPSDDISAAEVAWVSGIKRDFYNVGDALAPYLVADWLLGLWAGGSISYFTLYKEDSVFLKAVSADLPEEKRYLPVEAGASRDAFIAYCRTLRLPPEWIPERLWLTAFYNIPPGIVNEIIWLDINQSTPATPVNRATGSPATANGTGSAVSGAVKLSARQIASEVAGVLSGATVPLTAYEILEALPASLRDRIITERGLPGGGNSFTAATLVSMAAEQVIPSKDAPYRVYQNMVGRTFTVQGQTVKPGNSMIATYLLSPSTGSMEAAVSEPSFSTSVDPQEFSEETLDPEGHIPNPDNPYLLVVSQVPMTTDAPNSFSFSPITASVGGTSYLVAFTSRAAMRSYLGDGPNSRQRMELSALVSLFLSLYEGGFADEYGGILLDPGTEGAHIVTEEEMGKAIGMEVRLMGATDPEPRFPDTPPAALTPDSMVAVPIMEMGDRDANGRAHVLPVRYRLEGKNIWTAYTSLETANAGLSDWDGGVYTSTLQSLCEVYLSVCKDFELSGIVLNPGQDSMAVLSERDIYHFAGVEMPRRIGFRQA